MVTHQLPDDPDPVKTADQVISEIELMMDDCEPEMMQCSADTEILSASRAELWHFRENHSNDGNDAEWRRDLHSLSSGALNELLEVSLFSLQRSSHLTTEVELYQVDVRCM